MPFSNEGYSYCVYITENVGVTLNKKVGGLCGEMYFCYNSPFEDISVPHFGVVAYDKYIPVNELPKLKRVTCPFAKNHYITTGYVIIPNYKELLIKVRDSKGIKWLQTDGNGRLVYLEEDLQSLLSAIKEEIQLEQYSNLFYFDSGVKETIYKNIVSNARKQIESHIIEVLKSSFVYESSITGETHSFWD